jgi:macrolide transport system ATP-binding/permease protein
MTTWIEQRWQDLRHGIRLFAKAPGFTAIAVVSIACGTGANVAIFSAVDALLLRPLPVARPSELVTIGSGGRSMGILRAGSEISYPDLVDVRAEIHSFSGLVAYNGRRAGVSTNPSAPPRVRLVTSVTGNFFTELGIPLRLGRGFLPDEDRVPGRDPVAVLSYGMWQQTFGGDPMVIGREIAIAGTAFTIVGVAAESFTGLDTHPSGETVYVPFAMWSQVMNVPGRDPLHDRSLRVIAVKGRLATGVSLTEARTELARVARDLERAYPDTNTGQTLTAVSEIQRRFEASPLESGLTVITSILALAVLSVACANVAGLLTSRAPLRTRELAVRLAVGAGRDRLIAQLLTEGLLIALAGGAGGLGLGYAGIVLIRQIHFPTDIVAVPVVQMDDRAFAFSLFVALGSALLFGLGPALRATRIDLSNSLRVTEVARVRRWRVGGRHQLVAIQVALSLTLLTVAAASLQAFTRVFNNGAGFRNSHIAKLSIDASQARYAGADAARFFATVVDGARQLPGALSATVISAMPYWSVDVAFIVPEAYRLPPGVKRLQLFANVVDEQYFDTMDIPIVQGRAFASTDVPASPLVAIVNQSAARRYWPNGNAIGGRFRMNGEDPWISIVGIAKDSTYLYIAEPPQEMIYFPFRQQPRSNMVLLVHTAGPSQEPLSAMQALVRAVDPLVPVFDAQSMESFYEALVTGLGGVITSLIGALGLMGMTITVIGLYGLVSFAVNRRTREIGIRIAVGATYGRVMRMILRQGLAPAWLGMIGGLLLSAAAARLMPALVPTDGGVDLRVLFVVVPALVMVTLLAAFVPARRAALIDPTVALRED